MVCREDCKQSSPNQPKARSNHLHPDRAFVPAERKATEQYWVVGLSGRELQAIVCANSPEPAVPSGESFCEGNRSAQLFACFCLVACAPTHPQPAVPAGGCSCCRLCSAPPCHLLLLSVCS